ncbi:MAG: ComEC/Rec2 family competence protein, partial [bacterium]|nr:ComEC/Rec2 family competence protein [bacterium]
MSRSKVFLGLLVSFVVGIGLHELLPYAPNSFGWFALLCLATSLLVLLKSRTTAALLILCCALALGIFRGQSTLHLSNPETVDYYASEERNQVTVTGTVAEEPDIRFNKINYTIQTQSVITAGSETLRPVGGYLLISTGKYPKYEYGDSLEISGHLQRPTVFDSFDYAGYLSRFSIYSVMYRPRIKQMERSEPSTSPSTLLFSTLLKIKASFESQMNRTFSTEPSSSFMAG